MYINIKKKCFIYILFKQAPVYGTPSSDAGKVNKFRGEKGVWGGASPNGPRLSVKISYICEQLPLLEYLRQMTVKVANINLREGI